VITGDGQVQYLITHKLKQSLLLIEWLPVNAWALLSSASIQRWLVQLMNI